MSNNLVIPKMLKIGFQTRNDALTDKLGYVTYIDEKGVHRKKTSWENWRDKKINPLEIENTPMSGYIVNKGVVHFAYSSFGSERFRVRIHSPLGFEFEIYPQNMLAIMAVSDISKQYINSECVFAWDGTELVLLPVNTSQYEKAMENTKNLEAINTQKKKAGSLKNKVLQEGEILQGTNDLWTYVDTINIIPKSFCDSFKHSNIKLDSDNKVVLNIPSVTQKIGIPFVTHKNMVSVEDINTLCSQDRYISSYSSLIKIPDNAFQIDMKLSDISMNEQYLGKVEDKVKKVKKLIKGIHEIKKSMEIIELTENDFNSWTPYANSSNAYIGAYNNKFINFILYFEKECEFYFVGKDMFFYKVELKKTGKIPETDIYINIYKVIGNGKNRKIELLSKEHKNAENYPRQKVLHAINESVLKNTGNCLTVLKLNCINCMGEIASIEKIL